MSAILKSGRLPPLILAIILATIEIDHRFDGTPFGQIGGVRIANATLGGPLLMRIRIHQFAVFLSFPLAASAVYGDGGSAGQIEELREEAASLGTSSALQGVRIVID